MEVYLTSDQQAFAQQAVQAGRADSVEDVVQEALGLWEARERKRAQLLGLLDAAEASVARGEGREITKASMQQLASDVKARGRARLLAEQAEKH